MAFIHITFQQLLRFFRIFGIISNTWPPRPGAGKKELFFRDIYYNFIILIFAAVCIPMLINVFKNWGDISMMMKSLSQLAAMVEAVINLLLCTANRREMQVTIVIIESKFFLTY